MSIVSFFIPQHVRVLALGLVVSIAFASFTLARVAAEETVRLEPKDNLIVETVLRLKSFDLETSPPAKAAIFRYLRARAGTDQYFELLERFQPIEFARDLTEFSLANADTTAGVRAAEILFSMKQQSFLSDACDDEKSERAVAAIGLIGRAGGPQTIELLSPILASETAPTAHRIAAILAMGKQINGQKKILQLVKSADLPDELKFAAANVLLSSRDPSIVDEAKQYVSLPATADSQPLPTLTELTDRRGNAEAGKLVFRKQGTCSNCHKVAGEGKEVGPDLSEIGSKLSREAMYVAILNPSAAISHNFETYAVLTDDGTLETGLLISETDEEIVLRSNEGIDKTIDQETVELFEKQVKSMMPQDLQQLMTVDQLVDLVEYSMSLQKAK